MYYSKSLKSVLLLWGILLSLSAAFAQSPGAIYIDDNGDDGEDLFIIIGKPGLKPDSTTRPYPECARIEDGEFTLWIQVNMANMDDINLPCPLVVQADVSILGDENSPTVTIYSQPLNFVCSDTEFCPDCPNATFCSAHSWFVVSPSQFAAFCDGKDGEKVNINITASVVYECSFDGQVEHFDLFDYETPGCEGYLPEPCFNVSPDGSVRGEGCLVCSEEVVVSNPDTIVNPESEPSRLGKKTGEVSSRLPSLTTTQSLTVQTPFLRQNLVSSTLDVYATGLNETVHYQVIGQHATIWMKGQMNGNAIQQVDVSALRPGIYYLALVRSDQRNMIPFVKI